MRPLQLTMQAFGPYAGRQQLDFTPLAQHPLFLVHGPTGAGKSSILDALCHALFGEVSGSSRERGAQVRSLWARPDTLTEVTLDFALGDACYRIRRRPAQQRAKKRGEGTTQEGPKAWLWQRDPSLPMEEDGTLLESGERRVDERIEALLGLTAAQFRQVIVLPQGEFRRLLDANSAERQKILQKLFDTRLHALVEQALKERAAAARGQLQELRTRRKALLDAHGLETPAALQTALQEIDRDIELSSSAIEELEKKEHLARQQLEQAREVARKLHALADAERRLQALKQQAPRHEEMQQRLKRAEQAAAAQPAHSALCERRKAEEQARKALHAAEQAARKSRKRHQEAEQHLQQMRANAPRIEQLQQDITRLESLLPQIATLDRQRHEMQQLRQECHLLEQRLKQDEQALQSARASTQAAREHLQRLQAALQQAHALALSLTLQDGAPCPVCGATEHPAPAHQRHDQHDQQAIGATARQSETTQAPALDAAPSPQALQAAQQALQQAEKREEEARQQQERQRRTLEQKQARLQALTQTLQELEAHIIPQWREEKKAASALEAMRKQHATLQQALQQAEESFLQAQQNLQLAQARLEDTKSAHEKALQQREKQEIRFAEQLLATGFDDETQWLAAQLPAEERQRMHESISTWHQQLAMAQALAQQAAQAAAGLQQPDTEALQGAWQEAEAALRQAREHHGRLLERRQALQHAAGQLQKLADEEHALRERADDLQALGALASGDNPARITLERYVLATLLEEVLLAASERLRVMSDGRYLLQRRDEARRGGGLELDVFDAWTGETRAVQTLSGGESFLAALSLALGLADVVQARSGGMRMDALFIDEGFGALDADALERALDALLRLQSQGRLIGIISHVPELRERIPARIEVIATRHGSHIRLHTG